MRRFLLFMFSVGVCGESRSLGAVFFLFDRKGQPLALPFFHMSFSVIRFIGPKFIPCCCFSLSLLILIVLFTLF